MSGIMWKVDHSGPFAFTLYKCSIYKGIIPIIEKSDWPMLSFDLWQSIEFEIRRDFLNVINLELQYELDNQINSMVTRTKC